MVKSKWYLHPVIAVGVIVNVYIMGLAVAWSGPDPALLWRLLGEDGIVEWMQFLCFVVTGGLLAFAAADRWRRNPRVTLDFLALVGLALLVLAAAGEEVSWFQRVLHIDSPEFFLQNNKQAETNLHNLALGESGSIHKTILLKLIAIVGLTHNIVLPLLARSRPGIRAWVEKLGLYLPPLSASIIYIALVAISHALIDHPRKGELGEMFGAVHYLATVFAAYFGGLGYGKPPVFDHDGDRCRAAWMMALGVVFLLMNAWLLAAGVGATGA